MATRKDTRSFSDGTTSTFEKAGDSEAQVNNVSGAPSPNTEMVPRDQSAISDQGPGGPLPHRQPVQIDANSGLLYGEATRARTEMVWRKAANSMGHSQLGGYLDTVLGLDHGQQPDQAAELGANFDDHGQPAG